MSPHGVSERLRTVSRLLEERGFVSSGVDMSPSAVTLRLRSMGALSTMCLRLRQAKLASSSDK